jgi:hypothetical protein
MKMMIKCKNGAYVVKERVNGVFIKDKKICLGTEGTDVLYLYDTYDTEKECEVVFEKMLKVFDGVMTI